MRQFGCVYVLMYVLLFFFKQKTAYERRISDWSSDVCSSDLPFTRGVGLLSRVFGGMADRVGARVMLIVGPTAAAAAYVWMALGAEAPLMLGVIAPKTGRASCRERVCQYV